jgi:hypothetical protein
MGLASRSTHLEKKARARQHGIGIWVRVRTCLRLRQAAMVLELWRYSFALPSMLCGSGDVLMIQRGTAKAELPSF